MWSTKKITTLIIEPFLAVSGAIEVGEEVLAFNEETGKQAYKPVVRLFRNETKEWCAVSVLVNGKVEEIQLFFCKR